jgi:CheY-like chemotaxis protein/signal transduction histidine kinase
MKRIIKNCLEGPMRQTNRIILHSLIVGLFISAPLFSQEEESPASQDSQDLPVLAEFNYEPGSILSMEGHWKMIPGEIVAPNSNLWREEYVPYEVPGFWNDEKVRLLPDKAVATFQTTVYLPEARRNYGIYIPDVNTSYRLFVGNYLLKEMGEFSKDINQARGLLQPILLSVWAGGAVNITLQVVNGQDNWGGIKEAPEWADYPKIRQKVQNSWAWDSFFAGGFVLLGIFHIIQYLLNTQQDNNLFIGLTSFLMGVRTLQVGERIVSHWFAPLGFDILIKFEFLITYPLVLMITFLMRTIFRKTFESSKFFPILLNSFMGVTIFFFVLNVFLPSYFLGIFFRYYEVGILLVGAALLALTVLASIKKEEGAVLLSVGVLVIFGVATNDILYARNIISTGFLLSAGLMVFMVLQSINISITNARAFLASQRLNQELRRLAEMQERFWARSTHELQTPLHGILGLSEHLLDKTSEEASEDRYQLKLIRGAASRLSQLTQRVLANRATEQQSLEVNKEVFNLMDIVDLVLAGVQTSKSRISQEITLQRKNKVTKVYEDPNYLERLLFRVLDYGLSDDQTSTVVLSNVGDEIVQLRLSFLRDKTESEGKEKKGNKDWLLWYSPSGEDLAYTFSKEAYDCGFRMDFINREPDEWLVVFHLKAVDEEFGPSSSVSRLLDESFPAPPSAMERRRVNQSAPIILVVDDEITNMMVMENFLRGQNYTIQKATNGHDALTMIHEKKPDIVLLDVMMPGISGYETCTRIREVYPANELPVILLTAKNRIQDMVTGFSVGANDFISKPFHKLELGARLDIHLRIAQLSKSYARFVPKDFLKLMGKPQILELEFGDYHRESMTVMFLYIRNYASLNKNLPPDDSLHFLNTYLAMILPLIHQHSGVIEKYQGDGILAVFPGDGTEALKAALAIAQAVPQLDHTTILDRIGDERLQVGLGLHRGDVILGTVGHEARMSGTVISDAVYLATKIGEVTRKERASIFFSESLILAAHELRLSLEDLGLKRLGGGKKAIKLYSLDTTMETATEG